MNFVEKMLIDPGAGATTCPSRYAADIDISDKRRLPTMRTATGDQVRYYGDKSGNNTVVGSDVDMTMQYAVPDVTKPMVSVSSMAEKGVTTVMGQNGAFLTRGKVVVESDTHVLPLTKENGVYWLEVEKTDRSKGTAATEGHAGPSVAAGEGAAHTLPGRIGLTGRGALTASMGEVWRTHTRVSRAADTICRPSASTTC